MGDELRRIRKPHCFLLYALAPEGLSAAQANRDFNRFLADRRLPLVLFHDHFIAHPGGVAIFYVEHPGQQEALLESTHLEGWRVAYHALIYADSPAAFDEQIAFTLRAYRSLDWEALQREDRPGYGGATGSEQDDDAR
jgi:hypothetical protein